MVTNCIRHLQGDGASRTDEEPEELFSSPRKPPPIVYSPQLDIMWLALMGLAAGTRMFSLMRQNSVV